MASCVVACRAKSNGTGAYVRSGRAFRACCSNRTDVAIFFKERTPIAPSVLRKFDSERWLLVAHGVADAKGPAIHGHMLWSMVGVFPFAITIVFAAFLSLPCIVLVVEVIVIVVVVVVVVVVSL